MEHGWGRIRKWALITGGTLCVILGIVTFWLPIPIGVPLILIGLPVLLRTSPHARRLIMHLASKWPAFATIIRKLDPRRRPREQQETPVNGEALPARHDP